MSDRPEEREIQERIASVFDGRPVYEADRRWAMGLLGLTVSDLAEAARCQSNTASYAVQGRHVGRAGRKLAELIGIPLEHLYPGHRPHHVRRIAS